MKKFFFVSFWQRDDQSEGFGHSFIEVKSEFLVIPDLIEALKNAGSLSQIVILFFQEISAELYAANSKGKT